MRKLEFLFTSSSRQFFPNNCFSFIRFVHFIGASFFTSDSEVKFEFNRCFSNFDDCFSNFDDCFSDFDNCFVGIAAF